MDASSHYWQLFEECLRSGDFGGVRLRGGIGPLKFRDELLRIRDQLGVYGCD